MGVDGGVEGLRNVLKAIDARERGKKLFRRAWSDGRGAKNRFDGRSPERHRAKNDLDGPRRAGEGRPKELIGVEGFVGGFRVVGIPCPVGLGAGSVLEEGGLEVDLGLFRLAEEVEREGEEVFREFDAQGLEGVAALIGGDRAGGAAGGGFTTGAVPFVRKLLEDGQQLGEMGSGRIDEALEELRDLGLAGGVEFGEAAREEFEVFRGILAELGRDEAALLRDGVVDLLALPALGAGAGLLHRLGGGFTPSRVRGLVEGGGGRGDAFVEDPAGIVGDEPGFVVGGEGDDFRHRITRGGQENREVTFKTVHGESSKEEGR